MKFKDSDSWYWENKTTKPKPSSVDGKAFTYRGKTITAKELIPEVEHGDDIHPGGTIFTKEQIKKIMKLKPYESIDIEEYDEDMKLSNYFKIIRSK